MPKMEAFPKLLKRVDHYSQLQFQQLFLHSLSLLPTALMIAMGLLQFLKPDSRVHTGIRMEECFITLKCYQTPVNYQ